MKRGLLVTSMLCMALGGCGRSSGDKTAGHSVASDARTVETTGSPATIGAYGPAEVPTPKFVEQAALSDMYEIGASKLALVKSRSTAIKAFAQHMIDAHEATSATLKALAAKAKPAAPLPTAFDDRHAALMTALEKAAPDKFDALYLDQQTQAHRAALGLMDSYATHGDDPALKSFAAETKPNIQEHLEAASKLDHEGADDTGKAVTKPGG